MLILFFVQVPLAEADSSDDDLRLQIEAIAQYIKYNFSPSFDPIDTSETRQIIADSASWIVNAQEENGHFKYEYVPFADEYLNDDNMVRQAGTLYILSEIYKHQTEKDPAVAAAVERSIAYLFSLNQKGKSNGTEFWCIRSSEKSIKCDLGTTGLALIGILNLVAADPQKESDYTQTIERYAEYIMLSRLPEKGFSGNYVDEDGFSKSESSYYNGEAMLALVRYYQYHNDETVHVMLDDVFTYLSAKGEYESPLYLWIMAALKDMNKLWPHEAYRQYAEDFTAWRLEQSSGHHATTHNYCAPVEGFTSAYSVIETAGTSTLLTGLEDEIEYWLGKTVGLQLTSTNRYRVAMAEGQLRMLNLSVPVVAHGGFLTGQNELTQRIDFTQHCASAYLQKLTAIEGERL